jgi:hypothetical protein
MAYIVLAYDKSRESIAVLTVSRKCHLGFLDKFLQPFSVAMIMKFATKGPVEFRVLMSVSGVEVQRAAYRRIMYACDCAMTLSISVIGCCTCYRRTSSLMSTPVLVSDLEEDCTYVTYIYLIQTYMRYFAVLLITNSV